MALLIIGIWAVLYLRVVFDPSFHAPSEIMPLALMAASYFLTVPVVKQIRKGNGEANGA